MPQADINFLAILVAGIAAMIIGFVWYGPLFGKQWMKLSGTSREQIDQSVKKGMTKTYILAFIGALVTAYVLSHVVDYVFADTVGAGIETGFWIWLGFAAPLQLGMVLWEGKPWKLYFLNTAHQFINLAVMAAILAVW